MNEALRVLTLEYLQVGVIQRLPAAVARNAHVAVDVERFTDDLVASLRSFVLAERQPDTHHEMFWYEYARPQDALLAMFPKWRRILRREPRMVRRSKVMTVKHHIAFPHDRTFPERLGQPVRYAESA